MAPDLNLDNYIAITTATKSCSVNEATTILISHYMTSYERGQTGQRVENESISAKHEHRNLSCKQKMFPLVITNHVKSYSRSNLCIWA